MRARAVEQLNELPAQRIDRNVSCRVHAGIVTPGACEAMPTTPPVNAFAEDTSTERRLGRRYSRYGPPNRADAQWGADPMPKYMVRANYLGTGAAGLLKDGGSGRAEAVQKLVASVGGSVESMYWALGEDDFYGIFELPDAQAAAAVSLAVAASGALKLKTSELLSVEQLDDAVRRRVEYRPPGG